ncbi:MAG: hypothetical protein Kow0089_20700 [Desulfobulbaceae bacterium]
MSDAGVCSLCGNEVDATFPVCPFCGHRRAPATPAGPERPLSRVVNLERGMPPVADALQRLEMELAAGRASGIGALLLIHGYGSSGRGGAIRDAVRQRLETLRTGKKVREVLKGEEFAKHAGPFRQLLKRFPELGDELRGKNPGITIVVL